MTEDIRNLKASLDKLHVELESLERLDPQARQRLSDALADIQTILSRDDMQQPTTGGEEDDSIGHRLSEAAREFESSHPTLSGMIGSVIDALSRMGI